SAMSTPPDPDDFLPLPPTDFQLLLILLSGPRHAYGITQAAEEEERSGVGLGIGSLYRMLARLKERGFLEEGSELESASGGPRRKMYRITELGVAVARAEAARLRNMLELADERLQLAERR
ncbi:MAG TPA: helix-turn-helix transcriptional regulator, partial [Longimicrobiales bacterium]|nr:helix-turn-helix transcriptional regulator [Longimicrobiales bacterium]